MHPINDALFDVFILCAACAVLIYIAQQSRRESKRTPYQPVNRRIGKENLRSDRFRISGVDRSTKMDVTDFIEADSPENARAKEAELSGIVVTRVDRA
jgi:hypothetical protein